MEKQSQLTKQESISESGTVKHTFNIRGRYWKQHCFPSLNDYLSEVGRNPKAGGRFKKQFVMIAINAIRRDLRGFKTSKPVILHYTFYEPYESNIRVKQRDRDNICGLAQKFILDALRDSHVIQDDKPEYVQNFDFKFYYTHDLPSIRVEIEEVETP